MMVRNSYVSLEKLTPPPSSAILGRDPSTQGCMRTRSVEVYILWSSIKYIKLRVVMVLESVLELETVIFLVSKQAPRFRKKILYQC